MNSSWICATRQQNVVQPSSGFGVKIVPGKLNDE
jgi:hypothetical protein